MYTSTASVGIPSGSGQIPHSYNIGLIHNLILLLFLRILGEILPTADTAADPSVVVGDLDATKHTAAMVEASPFDYTIVVEQIVVVAAMV